MLSVMKTLEINENENKINPSVIEKIGSSLYQEDNVYEVVVQVKLKNGVTINYKRNEEDDEFQELKKRAEHEKSKK